MLGVKVVNSWPLKGVSYQQRLPKQLTTVKRSKTCKCWQSSWERGKSNHRMHFTGVQVFFWSWQAVVPPSPSWCGETAGHHEGANKLISIYRYAMNVPGSPVPITQACGYSGPHGLFKRGRDFNSDNPNDVVRLLANIKVLVKQACESRYACLRPGVM